MPGLVSPLEDLASSLTFALRSGDIPMPLSLMASGFPGRLGHVSKACPPRRKQRFLGLTL